MFRTLSLDELTIDDERSFKHVALYEELKQTLRADKYTFRVPKKPLSWDRVLFLNLTFWDASGAGDVLVDDHIAADVVCHVAWHHVTQKELARRRKACGETLADPRWTEGKISGEAVLLAEAIASAFDMYLLGRLVGHAASSDFLLSQVPAMRDVAEDNGMSNQEFESLLKDVAQDPERAFEDLRVLLFDTALRLMRARNLDEASETMSQSETHRFGALLHHYELSNWVLYARAYGSANNADDPIARGIDAELRNAHVSLHWLEEHWIRGDQRA